MLHLPPSRWLIAEPKWSSAPLIFPPVPLQMGEGYCILERYRQICHCVLSSFSAIGLGHLGVLYWLPHSDVWSLHKASPGWPGPGSMVWVPGPLPSDLFPTILLCAPQQKACQYNPLVPLGWHQTHHPVASMLWATAAERADLDGGQIYPFIQWSFLCSGGTRNCGDRR